MSSTPPRVPEIDVLILSGGQSRRMGTDKAWVQWQGQPLISRVAAHALSQRLVQPHRLWVSCSPDNIARAQVDFEHALLDSPRFMGNGPLAGIHAGLIASSCDWLWVLPCDAVGFADDLLSRMLSLALSDPDIQAVTLSTSTPQGSVKVHPVWALISRQALPSLNRCLEAHELKVMSFFESIHTRVMPLAPQEILWNINRPEDLPSCSDGSHR